MVKRSKCTIMRKFVLYPPSLPPCTCVNEFVCYKPDFTQEQELYRVDGQPVNVIDNSQTNPALQSVVNQLPEYMPSQTLNTSQLSDKEIASGCIPRCAEVSDFEDIANNNLSSLSQSVINTD